MGINKLFLKTAFCCMACDGAIAADEVELVKRFANTSNLFDGLDVQAMLNAYVAEINAQGKGFLKGCLNELKAMALSEEQELSLAKTAIGMIAADQTIAYAEIAFFKQIRSRLQLSDAQLLDLFKDDHLFEKYPEVEPEDFLLPDLQPFDDRDWDVTFEKIELIK